MKPATTDQLVTIFWRELGATKDTRSAIDRVRAELLSSIRKSPIKAAAPKTRVTDEMLAEIVQRFADYHGIYADQIIDSDRRPEVSAVRWEVMWYLRETFGMTFAAIGERIGNRCHKDVFRACAIVRARFEAEPGLRERILAVGAGDARPELRVVA